MNSKIGEVIKNKTAELGMTRVEVATKMGVTEGAVRVWEKKGLDNTKIGTVKKLAQVLDMDPLVLLEIIPIPDKYILSNKVKTIAKKLNNIPEDKISIVDDFLDFINTREK